MIDRFRFRQYQTALAVLAALAVQACQDSSSPQSGAATTNRFTADAIGSYMALPDVEDQLRVADSPHIVGVLSAITRVAPRSRVEVEAVTGGASCRLGGSVVDTSQ